MIILYFGGTIIEFSYPMISVIVAVKNGEMTIQRCIDSVSSQTYPNKELVIMDGLSGDGTVEILRLNDEKITYWESSADTGICGAWNKALQHVTGKWIIFLGADDFLWNPDAFEKIVAVLYSAYPSYQVVYARVAICEPTGTILRVLGESWDKIRISFRCTMPISHQGIFHHRSLFDKYGIYDESFRIGGDYELLLRTLKDHDALFTDGLIVAGMQIGGESSRDGVVLDGLREWSKARRKNGITGLPIPIWHKYFKEYLRIVLSRILGDTFTKFLVSLYHKCKWRKSLKKF